MTTTGRIVRGLSDSDELIGTEGDDTLFGGGSNAAPEDAADTLRGGAGRDQLYGNGGNDAILGGADADSIWGGIGDDFIYGHGNDDTATDADSIVAGSGHDTIYAGGGNDTVIGGNSLADSLDGDDLIDAGAGDDFVFGNSGNDTIAAGAGNDTIYGGLGHDIMNGGEGNDSFYIYDGDTVTGGNGSDIFYVNVEQLATLSATGGSARIYITDLTSTDVLRFTHVGSHQLQLQGSGQDTLVIINGNTALTLSGVSSSSVQLPTTAASDTLTVAYGGSTPLTPLSGSNLTQFSGYLEDTVTDLGNIVVSGAATITATLMLATPALGALTTSTIGSSSSSYTPATGLWQATGSLADVNALLAAVQFTPAAESVANVSIVVNVNAVGSTGSLAGSYTLHGVEVLDTPTLSTPLTDQATTTDTPFTYAMAAGSFTDIDSTLSYTATLVDGSPLPVWLSFDAATQTFSGTASLGDIGSLNVRVTATDGTTNTSDDFTLTVANSFQVTNLTQALNYNEDVTTALNDMVAVGATTLTATLTLTNVALGALTTGTSGAVTATYSSITGIWSATGAVADVNALLASVAFVPTGESSANATITTSISDGSTTLIGSIALTGAAVNDVPTLSGMITTITYNENTVNATPQLLDSSVVLADVDSANFDGGTVTLSIVSGGSVDDQLMVQHQGTGAGQIGKSGATLSYGGTAIGTLSGGTNGTDMIVSLNSSATVAAVDALIQNITYQNSNNVPTAPRTIQLTINDGDGGTSAAHTIAVTITSQSDTYAITSASDSLIGGTTNDTFTGAFADLAIPGDTLTGAGGTDVLSITSGTVTLDTATFTTITGIENITLGTDAAHSITVHDGYFATAGMGNTLTITSNSAHVAGVTVNASAVSTASKVVNIVASGGNDVLQGTNNNDAMTLNGGDDNASGLGGNDSFVFAATNFNANDSIAGGAGTDTLSITSGTASLDLAALPNLVGVETISLGTNGAHSITAADGYFATTGFSGTTLTLTTTSTTGVALDSSAVLTGHNLALTAAGGNDTLTGGAGADTLNGGGGDDNLIGNAGNDRFSYSVANLTTADTLTGGTGTADQLYISAGTFALNLDTLTNISSIESIYFNNAASHSLSLSDTYFATGLDGTTVTVTANGAAVGISVDGSAITSAANSLNLTGNTGNDTLLGGAGNDTLTASTGVDDIRAGDGNDRITIASAANYTSADTIHGGNGSDTITLSGGSGNFVFDATTTSTLLGVEVFSLARNGAHSLTIDDAYFASTGFAGTTLTATTSSNVGVVFNGAAVASAANSVSLSGGTSNDTLTGGAGADTLSASSGTDLLNAGSGNDLIVDSGSNITAADSIAGGAGSDIFRTNAGTLAYNSGTFTAFTGIETFELNNNANHSLTFTDAHFTTTGYVGTSATVTMTATNNITITGASVSASYALNLTGGTGNNSFTGGAGADTLDGGAGTDSLTGGLGADRLTGGTGNDNFIYSAATQSGIGAGLRDIITDFATGDKINLSAFTGTFTFRTGGLGETNFSGSINQVAWQQVGGNTIVYVDSDANNSADFQIELTGLYTLASTDFTL